MFERYPESSRRVIFFARHEALSAGHKEIETTDLLRGLAREWAELRQALNLQISPAQIDLPPMPPRKAIIVEAEAKTQDVSFAKGVKTALRLAARLADGQNSWPITVRHLLAGLAAENAAVAKLLKQKKVKPEELPLTERQEPERARAIKPAVGIGYDYHRLVEGRKLILGGVEIPFNKGLAGHSDGDVLTHALCDALLGAAGLGDLGQHFPDTDPRWKEANSLELLARVVDLLGEKKLRVVQVDTVVLAQEPKLVSYFAGMRETLARTMAVVPAQVNVKAKTTEGLEAIGRGEAMAAQAIVLLKGI